MLGSLLLPVLRSLRRREPAILLHVSTSVGCWPGAGRVERRGPAYSLLPVTVSLIGGEGSPNPEVYLEARCAQNYSRSIHEKSAQPPSHNNFTPGSTLIRVEVSEHATQL